MKFSFLIPCYNTEKYVKECVESIKNQSYQDWEIILINDGSTDHTEEILYDLTKKDSKIKVFNQKNAGVSATRNKLVELATGDYLIFVDSDDRYKSKDCLKRITEVLSHGMVDILVFRYEAIWENGNSAIDGLNFFASMKGQTFTGEEYLLQVLKYADRYVYPWYPFLYVFRREFWVNSQIQFNEKFWIYEDLDIIYKIILKAQKVKTLNQVIYQYRQRESSAAHNWSLQSMQDRLKGCINIIEIVDRMEISIELKKMLNSNFVCIYFNILSHVYFLKKKDRQIIFHMLRDNVYLMEYTIRHRNIWIKRFISVFGLRIISRLLFMRKVYMERKQMKYAE